MFPISLPLFRPSVRRLSGRCRAEGDFSARHFWNWMSPPQGDSQAACHRHAQYFNVVCQKPQSQVIEIKACYQHTMEWAINAWKRVKMVHIKYTVAGNKWLGELLLSVLFVISSSTLPCSIGEMSEGFHLKKSVKMWQLGNHNILELQHRRVNLFLMSGENRSVNL